MNAMIQLKNILLPTDFSEPGLEAANYAVEMAERFGATLHLLHVIVDPVIYLPMFESYPMPSKAEFEQYAQERMEGWLTDDDKKRCNAQLHWVHGTPFVEIINFARENEIDLIVMGTHGHGAIAHMLTSSEAEKVVRKAPCPVLTVRPEGHQFVHP
ncbi:putative universal stress protein [Symmachiella macrocystis]|nr:universal stress protein [Symmachiella macrocystis]TWU14084.1 putative universal stress protein [Symmachiella macrocystis]